MFSLFIAIFTSLLGAGDLDRAAWPQFRGPHGLGTAPDGMKLPVHFGPTQQVVWKTALPRGLSSPCTWGQRLFLTGFDQSRNKLEAFCLDLDSGQIRWRQAAPVEQVEKVFPTNSPATPTPATDGERVYVYFGSFGLLCYDLDGKLLWKKPLPPPGNQFGSGTSPIVAGELVVLACQGKQPSLLAVNRRSGETVWKRERPRFGAPYSVPLYRTDGPAPEIILSGGRGVVACEAKTGKDIWWVGGVYGGGIPTPILSDGLLFVVAHFPGGDPDDHLKLPPFAELLAKYDKNKDGRLAKTEVPADLIIYDRGRHDAESSITMDDLFGMIDKNKDDQLDAKEWAAAIVELDKIESALLAIRPGGSGDVTASRVVWRARRALPEVPSPLCYRDRLYLVKDGGIASCYEAQTGKVVYRKRLGAGGFYYASPVAGDGKIYAASEQGVVVVFRAGDRGEVLARNDVGEPILATPAFANGKLLVRTAGHLYAFRE
jgi:outer membrane protein assembly factor BamB